MKNWKKRFGFCLAVFMLLCIQPLTAQAAMEPMEAIGIPVDAADVDVYSVASLALEPEENSFYYGRNALAKMSNSKALLYAYDAIAAGVEDCAESIGINDGSSTLTLNELHIIMDAYRRDYAHHFWLGSAYSYTYNPQTGNIYDLVPGYFVGEKFVAGYLLSGAELTAARAAFEQEIEEILGGVEDDWSDFEKELYFHDLLADRVTYIMEGTHIYNAYGALIEGKAVCEGYAEALQVLLHRAEIQSFIITGESRGVGHEWNVVCIDDEWYHVDATWDDQGSELYHAYFNVTDDVIAEGHDIDKTAYALPFCDSMDANYFTVMGGMVTEYDVEQIAAMMKAQGLTIHVWLDGDEMTTAEYLAEYMKQDNIWQLIELTGATNVTSYSYGVMGREMVLHLEGKLPPPPDGLSGVVGSVKTDRLTVSVRGLFERETTADLYIAVYNADGKMIGIARVEDQLLLVSGTNHTVGFKGMADHVGLFALNGSGVPYDGAAMLEIE